MHSSTWFATSPGFPFAGYVARKKEKKEGFPSGRLCGMARDGGEDTTISEREAFDYSTNVFLENLISGNLIHRSYPTNRMRVHIVRVEHSEID